MNRRGATASVVRARDSGATVAAASGTAASAACDITPMSKHGNSSPLCDIERGTIDDRVWPEALDAWNSNEVLSYCAGLASSIDVVTSCICAMPAATSL